MKLLSFINCFVFISSLLVGCRPSSNELNIEELQAPDPPLNKDMAVSGRNSFIESITSGIASHESVDGKYVGYSGTQTNQYKRYEQLKSYASESELIALADSPIPNVKVYAFWALEERNSKACNSILEKHINDTAKVLIFSACIGEWEYINLHYLSLLSDKLTEEQKIIYKQTIAKNFTPEKWADISRMHFW